MKCPVYREKINELDEVCPNCKTNFDEYEEHTKKAYKRKNGVGCCIVVLILVAIIFVPIIVGTISSTIQSSKAEKHEQQLIEEKKVKTAEEVIYELAEIFKNKDESKIKEYLSEDFSYYDNENIKHKYPSSFFKDLKVLTSSYDIERRGNSIQDEETYRIYWNVVELNKKWGRESEYYCLQRIEVMLKREIKENVITYEVEKLVLKNN